MVDTVMVDTDTLVRDLLTLKPRLMPLLMPMLMLTTVMDTDVDTMVDITAVDVVDTVMVDTDTLVRDLLTLTPRLLPLLMPMLMLTTVMDTDVDTMVDITAVDMVDTVMAEDTTGDK